VGLSRVHNRKPLEAGGIKHSSQQKSLWRLVGLNRVQGNKFFQILTELYKKYKFPSSIFFPIWMERRISQQLQRMFLKLSIRKEIK
jgi:hypothetical protein